MHKNYCNLIKAQINKFADQEPYNQIAITYLNSFYLILYTKNQDLKKNYYLNVICEQNKR